MVALLEQHTITLWTIGDLFLGALDARLDPHYRLSRSSVAMGQLQTSWKILACAFVAVWLALFFWFVTWDMGLPDVSTCNRVGPACLLRVAMYAHTPSGASAILDNYTPLAFYFFPLFLAFLVRWVVIQAKKNKWNLLRLLPIASAILLYLYSPTPPTQWWLHSLFIVSLALLVESWGAMLISGRRWEQRHSFRLAIFIRLLILLVTMSMIPVCVACGVWLAAMWKMFPQIENFYPDTQPILMGGLAVMVLAIMIAFFALVRNTLTLKMMYEANPKQDMLQPIQPIYDEG